MEGCVPPTHEHTREVKLSFKAKNELKKEKYISMIVRK